MAIQVFFVLYMYTKFEVRRPLRSEDMTHFRCQHYLGLVTLTFAFDLETSARGVDKPSYSWAPEPLLRVLRTQYQILEWYCGPYLPQYQFLFRCSMKL